MTRARAATAPRATTRLHDPVQRRTLLVLIAAQILGTLSLGAGPTIGILLAEQVTADETWAGLARTSSTLGAALLGLPLGTLAARHGRRVALATGWWISAAGAGLLVLAAQHQLVIPLFLGLLMTGAGTAAALQARFTATDLATPATRARALSLVVWMGAIGNVLGPNIGVPGEALGRATGLDTYAASFALAAAGCALAGAVLLALLRPDPLAELARRTAGTTDAAAVLPTASRPGPLARLRGMTEELRADPRARTALVALLTSQVVMVALMTMTPVHLAHRGDSLSVVGLTISLHVLGMFGLSPLVGHLVDRLGHRAVVGIGAGLFALSEAFAALTADTTGGVIAALVLLGLGWSFMNVAGSALFAAVVPDRSRAAAQGGADALSNLCGAIAAFLAGPAMVATSFATLGVLAAAIMLPMCVTVLRPGAWRGPATEPAALGEDGA